MRRAEGEVQPAARARQTSIAESFGVAGRYCCRILESDLCLDLGFCVYV